MKKIYVQESWTLKQQHSDGGSFHCVCGSHRVKRTLGLGSKSAGKSVDRTESFQTLRESMSDQRPFIFRVKRAIWNKQRKVIMVYLQKGPLNR